MNGFLNVLKPVGATASDVVVRLKYILHEKKIGHLGTLDPGASGVLPVAVGQGTKLFAYLTNKVKVYRAFFTFGKTTDTLDSYGLLTGSCDVVPTAYQLQQVLARFVGEQQQVPPVYSAISVGGVRSYKLVRQGETVQLKPRTITVYDISLVEQRSQDTFVVDISCSGGTYIRSLARDIAECCGTVGYMSALIRLSSGCFDIDNALTLEEIEAQKEQCLLDIQYPLADVPLLQVDDALYDRLSNGGRIRTSHFDGYKKIYCRGEFFGLGSSNGGLLKLDYYLKNAYRDTLGTD